MSRSASPLRYPGGKACLYGIAKQIICSNDLQQRNYAEPYSGGCGLALSLLFNGYVSFVHLNDLDRSIWAFWYSVLYETDNLVSMIEAVSIDISQWEVQRAVQLRKNEADILELGFSTFFVNRTNRSGIIHSGGVIGGKSQSGSWKIDCRFNKQDLINRIRRVALYKNKIKLYNEDAIAFLEQIGGSIPATSILYIDPPYYEKGSQLYKNSYKRGDHEHIARKIQTLKNPWFMTYDNVAQIKSLYDIYNYIELDIGYSVQTKKRGSELLIASSAVKIPITDRAEVH